MSLKVTKAGVLDTVQDLGRYGYQHLGINPGGVMDVFAMQVANMLLGNDKNTTVIELHFPAATFLFEKDAMIAITGADFTPMINNKMIPLYQPVVVSGGSVLQFKHLKTGVRSYLAIKEELQTEKWLGSSSTNLKAETGGYKGRVFQKEDIIEFKEENDYSSLLNSNDSYTMPWKAGTLWYQFENDSICVLPGNEWNWVDENSKNLFLSDSFKVTAISDRMGYKLNGPGLSKINEEELVSSAVSFGTIQLLPDGQLTILMADHQTTGGYPRIAHVITAHHSQLSQVKSEELISFSMIEIKLAEDLLIKQQMHLLQLENACKFRLEEFLKTGP